MLETLGRDFGITCSISKHLLLRRFSCSAQYETSGTSPLEEAVDANRSAGASCPQQHSAKMNQQASALVKGANLQLF